jgi:recombination protein RecR
MYTSETLERIIAHLTGLPSIGRKTAQRIALHLLKQPREKIVDFAEALRDLKDKIVYCSVCRNITEHDPCAICTSPKRNRQLVCVVHEPHDVFAIERTNEFNGVYHVLHGALNPLEGIGPEELDFRKLLDHIRTDNVEEVILALSSTVEGDATAMYVDRLLRPLGVLVTRIARGVPVGSDLEYTDEVTIARSMAGRTRM